MPFGFRSAKDEFQRKINEIIEGLQGIATLVADILVMARRARSTTQIYAISRKRGHV